MTKIKIALLEELQITKPLVLVEAQEKDGKLYMKGKVQQTSVNQNGRKYSKELWEKLFEDPDYQHKLEKGLLIGGIGHPKDGIFEPDKGCLVTRSMELVNDEDVDGILEILTQHPHGRIMEIYYRSGVFLPVSSRGRGDSTTDSDGNIEVVPGTYIYEGHDAVIEPSVKDAAPEYVQEALINPKNFLKYEELMREALKVEKIDLKFIQEARKLVPVTWTESGKKGKELVSLMESKESEITGTGTPSGKKIHLMDGLEIEASVLAEAITSIQNQDKEKIKELESKLAEQAVDINKNKQSKTNNHMAEKTPEQLLTEEIGALRSKLAVQESTAKLGPLEEKIKAAKALVEAQDKKIVALQTLVNEEKTKASYSEKRLVAASQLAEAAINKAKSMKVEISEGKANYAALKKVAEAFQTRLESTEKFGISKVITAELAKFPEGMKGSVKKALNECKTAAAVQAVSESMLLMAAGFMDPTLPPMGNKGENFVPKSTNGKVEKDIYEGMDPLTKAIAEKQAAKQAALQTA